MHTGNRLEHRLDALRKAGKKAFVTFATAGYPNLDLYADMLGRLPQAGADIIEIGVPFSDPMADGPAIQVANIRALKAGITLHKVLDMVRAFRKKDNETPIVLMGYYNPIYSYGIMKFLDDAAKAGVDGFIIPDLPPEEDAEFRIPAFDRNMNLMRLVTPTTDDKRLPTVLKDASGFIYCVSITGITGSASANVGAINKYVTWLREKTTLPIAIGFGVNTPNQAREMAKTADGVIVGSAIMKRIESHLAAGEEPNKAMIDDALALVKELADAVHG